MEARRQLAIAEEQMKKRSHGGSYGNKRFSKVFQGKCQGGFKLKTSTKLLFIVSIVFLITLTGCDGSTKSLAESIQGHWTNNAKYNKGELFISDNLFTTKDGDGTIRKFTYKINAENPDNNFIILYITSLKGSTSSHKIEFTDDERKSAIHTVDGLKREMSYIDNQKEPK